MAGISVSAGCATIALAAHFSKVTLSLLVEDCAKHFFNSSDALADMAQPELRHKQRLNTIVRMARLLGAVVMSMVCGVRALRFPP